MCSPPARPRRADGLSRLRRAAFLTPHGPFSAPSGRYQESSTVGKPRVAKAEFRCGGLEDPAVASEHPQIDLVSATVHGSLLGECRVLIDAEAMEHERVRVPYRVRQKLEANFCCPLPARCFAEDAAMAVCFLEEEALRKRARASSVAWGVPSEHMELLIWLRRRQRGSPWHCSRSFAR
jgi:hypothetical protein